METHVAPHGAHLAPDGDPTVLAQLGIDSHGRRRKIALRILEALIAVAIVAAGLYAWRRASAPVIVSYETHAAVKGDLVVLVTATGTLEPATAVDVGPEISGRVRKVHVDYNDHVAKGEVLVELDTDLLTAQAEQADSQVALAAANERQARAAWDEATQMLARTAPLVERGVSSAQELDTSRAAESKTRAALGAAAAQLRAARAAAVVARTNLEKATIRSPIDGVVLTRSVDEGQTVVAAFQAPVLLRLAEDLSRMQLVVDVDEADVGGVLQGQKATFTVAAYGDRVFEAKVSSVRNSAKTRENVVTYEAVLDVENREGLLRPGMTGTAQITTGTHTGALLVPNAALRFHPPGEAPTDTSTATPHRVYVLQGGRPVAVPVTPGATDGARTAIADGQVPVGAEIVVDLKQGKK